MPFETMREVMRANHARGHHWFEPDTLRFFRSRIETDVIGGRFFVTSEQFVMTGAPPSPRRYTVREAHDDGSIGTYQEPGREPVRGGVGGFQMYGTRETALDAIRRALEAHD